jgi:hypothetical protein
LRIIGVALQPRWSCNRGVRDLERERARLLVRDQSRE